ncbi:hypothetical protein PAXINDRAFT_12116 [Paxillus involutus ATCC 200175]|uniref:Uncharacterized protein n=1 Tax=Paxillus involutus ATCC 200175 TaxID=664439 RepID=A0A0C9SYS8_PAXIN|nr:hypothetical protein PAXINDRAFT_12116 [Paxillus involutus ATCC 200175]
MTIDHTSAAVSLVNIAKVSQQLIATATGYTKDTRNTSNSHIQLEAQLQHIVVASNLALKVVNKSSLSNNPDIDLRLVEWLSSDEPHNCFITLKAIQELLKESLTWQFFRNILSLSKGDKMKEAIMLFNAH